MHTNETLEKSFKLHEPKADQQFRYVALRDTAKKFAFAIAEFCPESREKGSAFSKLEESLMWANKSIAVNE